MDSQQDTFVAAMRQVQTFISSAPTPEIGAIANSGMMTTFNDAVANLSALGVAQKQNTQEAQGETTKQGRLRGQVLQAMAPIAKIAKVKLTTLPELSAFKVPRADTKSAQLIIAATAMANAAEPYAAMFTAQGLASTFVTDLQSAAAALETSIDARATFKVAAVGATKGTAGAVTEVKAALGALDSMVQPLITGNSTLLGQWEKAKKVAKKPGVPVGTPKAVSVSIAPAAPTAPAPAVSSDHLESREAA